MKRLLVIGFSMFLACHGVLRAQDTKENADFKLAVNLYNDKLYDLALEQFRQFVGTYPNTQQGIEARFYLGLTQSKLGKYEDARLTFQNFALAFPDHPKAPEAWWNVAEAYEGLGSTRDAAQAYERLKTFHPRSTLAPSALLKASQLYRSVGDTTNAVRVLRSLTQDYTSSDVVFPGRLELAEFYLAQGQYELARTEARRVSDVTSDRDLKARGLLVAGEALKALGQLQEARTSFSGLSDYSRGGSRSYFRSLLLLGEVDADLGDNESARKSWRTLAGDSVRAPADLRQEAHLQLADAALAEGDARAALREYERASGIRGPRTSDAFFRAARVAEQLGELQKAGNDYLQAERDSSSRLDRGSILIGAMEGSRLLGNFHRAVQFAQRFQSAYPTDPRMPRVLLEASRVYRNELSDPRRAFDLLSIIVGDYPTSPLIDDAIFEQGLALEASGLLNEAVETFDRLVQSYPCSDFRQRASDEARRIRLFAVKERAGGLENLAMLIGGVIENTSRGELAFRLGEIFFNDLKEYEKAIDQYNAALKYPLDARTKSRALLRRAQAYDNLAWRARLQGANDFSRWAQGAIAAYDSLLAGGGTTEGLSDAAQNRLLLRLDLARSTQDITTLAGDVDRVSPPLKDQGLALVAVAEAYQRVGDLESAVGTLRRALAMRSASSTDDALFLLARVQQRMGLADSAAISFDEYCTRFPNKAHAAEAMDALAQYRASQGDLAGAHDLYDNLEQRFFYAGVASEHDLQRGDAYFAGKDYARAARSYERFLLKSEEDVFLVRQMPASAERNLAVSYEQVGNLTKAKQWYLRALAGDTSSAWKGETWLALAGIARRENNLPLATRYLELASRSGGGVQGVRNPALEAADLLFESDQYTDALGRYQAVSKEAKDDSVRRYAQLRSIICYYRLDNLKEADRQSNAFVRQNPKAEEAAAEFEYERGKYHLRREELETAAKRFVNVAKLYRKAAIVPEALYWLARTEELQNKTPDAVQLYDSLLHAFPKSKIVPRIRLALGNAYYSLEQWDNARIQYQNILDNAAASPDLVPYAMSNLILVYKELSLYDAALQLTRKYIEQYPDDPDLIGKRVDIGVLYQKLGYYDQSILHLQGLLANADADLEAELRYYIGEGYYYKGDYQQAILEFLKVPYLVTRQTKADWVAPSYYMAGQSYEKMSKFDQAIGMYQQIIDRPGIDTTFKTAAQKEIDRVRTLVQAPNEPRKAP